MDKIINESDNNEQKVKAASTAPAGDDRQDNTVAAGTQLFDPAGAVAPSTATAGSGVPDLPEGKKKRGPKPKSAEEKAAAKRERDRRYRASKSGRSSSADVSEVPDYIQAAALYNMVLVAGCKLVSDEFEQSEEMQSATIKAACEYFESIDVNLPPWAGLLAVSAANITAALKTPSGKDKVAGAWAKIKGWYVSRKG